MKTFLQNNPLIYVDVGASGGIHKRWYQFGSGVKSILFEPDKKEFEKLASNESENAIIVNSALAEKSKKVDFHICNRQEVSSIYKPNRNLLERYENPERFHIQRTISLEANSIDNLLPKEGIHEIDFIKIDTQGSELDILKGANNYFGNLIGLEVEVEFVELYQGQPLFTEVNSFVESKGFSLIDLRRYYWRRKEGGFIGRKGQLIFADALYFREPENLASLVDLTQEKIMRAIHVYLAYGYDDFAITLFQISENENLLSEESLKGIQLLLQNSKRKYVLPDFRGKGRIKNLISYIGDKFSTRRFYAGTDIKLGND